VRMSGVCNPVREEEVILTRCGAAVMPDITSFTYVEEWGLYKPRNLRKTLNLKLRDVNTGLEVI